MRLTNGGLGPCSDCLNARNMLKRIMARALGKHPQPFTLITLASGAQVVVHSDSGEVRVTTPDAKALLGLKLYHSKRYIFDIETADRIDTFGKVQSAVGLTDG